MTQKSTLKSVSARPLTLSTIFPLKSKLARRLSTQFVSLRSSKTPFVCSCSRCEVERKNQGYSGQIMSKLQLHDLPHLGL
ncbi:hypothetical protein PROFUN_10381 [Planoprotostelium fungivorum]|uniref:Uncharacterized protein n=1 Tax=Planoprotostelium fungivorum TaxID=1890364 RepID=A0A2P6NEC0_9EUKA|nr:hypothetical protein PROFUN_10381 [Planoprotostelium fungivorum]